MKVLLINGSPNASGCTRAALDECAKTLKERGADTELIQVGGKNILGCAACYKCRETGKCVIDDIVNETAAKLAGADGLVIGSPVYYASPNGTLISFLDRLFFSSMSVNKVMKVGAAIVSARRAGTTAALDALNKYFLISGMPIAPSKYWNMVHGREAEDVKKDEEGLQVMRVLGRNMAFMIKSFALGKEKFGLPEAESRNFVTNFIR